MSWVNNFLTRLIFEKPKVKKEESDDSDFVAMGKAFAHAKVGSQYRCCKCGCTRYGVDVTSVWAEQGYEILCNECAELITLDEKLSPAMKASIDARINKILRKHKVDPHAIER